MQITPIAKIYTDFKSKFGIPRQSGRVNSLIAKIVFEKPFRNPDALRGIEEFSHLWLIFDFSKNHRKKWNPTVRPPRLGGNTRIGVFASRSSFRVNNLGLSCVKLEKIEIDEKYGACLIVSGADILDKTPIFDIKPYIPYCDCKIDAIGSYADIHQNYKLSVSYKEDIFNEFPKEKLSALLDCISEDPRPSYKKEGDKIYYFDFDKFKISFKVENKIATIISCEKNKNCEL